MAEFITYKDTTKEELEVLHIRQIVLIDRNFTILFYLIMIALAQTFSGYDLSELMYFLLLFPTMNFIVTIINEHKIDALIKKLIKTEHSKPQSNKPEQVKP